MPIAIIVKKVLGLPQTIVNQDWISYAKKN